MKNTAGPLVARQEDGGKVRITVELKGGGTLAVSTHAIVSYIKQLRAMMEAPFDKAVLEANKKEAWTAMGITWVDGGAVTKHWRCVCNPKPELFLAQMVRGQTKGQTAKKHAEGCAKNKDYRDGILGEILNGERSENIEENQEV